MQTDTQSCGCPSACCGYLMEIIDGRRASYHESSCLKLMSKAHAIKYAHAILVSV